MLKNFKQLDSCIQWKSIFYNEYYLVGNFIYKYLILFGETCKWNKLDAILIKTSKLKNINKFLITNCILKWFCVRIS